LHRLGEGVKTMVAARVLSLRPKLVVGAVGCVLVGLLGNSPADAAPQGASAVTYSAYGWGQVADYEWTCAYSVNYDYFNGWQAPVEGLGSTIAVAGGNNFAEYLQSDGTMLGCGEDDYGELGDGGQEEGGGFQNIPASNGLSNVTAIAASDDNGFALTSGGSVYSWGANTFGEDGNGTADPDGNSPTFYPVETDFPSGTDITAITANGIFALALDSTGHVWTWGADESGELGNGTTETYDATPTLVPGLSGVAAIAAGNPDVLEGDDDEQALALLDNGTVDAWGADYQGQLGIGSTGSPVTSPTPVPGLTDVVAISAGGEDSFAVTSTGALYSWGENNYGDLGIGSSTPPTDTPELVSGLPSMSRVSAGTNTTEALSAIGGYYCWGLYCPGNVAGADGLAVAPVGAVSLGNTVEGPLVAAENPASLTANKASVTIRDGASQQLHVTAGFPAGGMFPESTADATGTVTWSSDDSAVASVNSEGGPVTANQPSGSTTVAAAMDGLTADTTVTDSPPPPPSVTKVAPASGTTAGGSSISLTGTNFTDVTAVDFGNNPATSFEVTSPTKLTAIAPVGSAGPVAVTVTTPGGKSTTNSGDVYTYSSTAVAISTTSLPAGTKGAAYKATLTATGGTTPYSWSASSLPKGLKLAAGTGKLTGKPKVNGTFSISFEVTDAKELNDTITLAVKIAS